VLRGRVVKLDRGFPLVLTEDGGLYRCKHATALVKERKLRAAIGDLVDLELLEGDDKALIKGIQARKNTLVRKDPTEQTLPQVLAANFDRILITQPMNDINPGRLARELVVAHETGAAVTVVLTKADLAKSEKKQEASLAKIGNLVDAADVLVVSEQDPQSVEAIRALIPPGEIAVMVGRSGVGKSSLVNLLVGYDAQKVAGIREADGKGRHTTASREMIAIPQGGSIVDMPGIRGLGLWDAQSGIEAAFADIEELALQCRFRDCRHEAEPGCAVAEALQKGELPASRIGLYRTLRQETALIQERREEAERKRARQGHPRHKNPPSSAAAPPRF